MTEHQQEAWIYTFERIALVQKILNGGAAALVAALKAEESYMLRQIYDDITYVPPGITLQDACQNMCDKALRCGLHLPLNQSSSLSYTRISKGQPERNPCQALNIRRNYPWS